MLLTHLVHYRSVGQQHETASAVRPAHAHRTAFAVGSCAPPPPRPRTGAHTRMRRHRTTARGTLASILLAGLVAAALATPAANGRAQGVPRLVFPLVAKTDLWDNHSEPPGE